jgi:hypothetical protein
MIITLRSNASQKSIDNAIATLRREWAKADENAEILFYEDGKPIYDRPETFYLQIGEVIRWGVNGEFEAWGYCSSDISRDIAGQKEYAYSR